MSEIRELFERNHAWAERIERDDPGFFPFGLQADVDDRHATPLQLFKLGVVDVDDLGPGELGKSEKAGDQ